jgi:hypothetical protein
LKELNDTGNPDNNAYRRRVFATIAALKPFGFSNIEISKVLKINRKEVDKLYNLIK